MPWKASSTPNYGLLCLNKLATLSITGLLWGRMAYYFGRLGFPSCSFRGFQGLLFWLYKGDIIDGAPLKGIKI